MITIHNKEAWWEHKTFFHAGSNMIKNIESEKKAMDSGTNSCRHHWSLRVNKSTSLKSLSHVNISCYNSHTDNLQPTYSGIKYKAVVKAQQALQWQEKARLRSREKDYLEVTWRVVVVVAPNWHGRMRATILLAQLSYWTKSHGRFTSHINTMPQIINISKFCKTAHQKVCSHTLIN